MRYKIGDFSILAKLTVKTLRFYEEEKLLLPDYVDEFTGYRYYDTAQLSQVSRIVALRQAGVSIEGIRRIISGDDALAILNQTIAESKQQLTEVQNKILLTATLIKSIKENRKMKHQAIVKQLPEYTVYYKRGILGSFADITPFILGSAEECRAANPGIKCVEPDYCFVRYLDGEYKEKDISFEYAQAVTKAGVETDTIKFRVLPGTRAVCVYHKGPYSTLRETYSYVYNFVKDNGFVPTELAREHYIDGMWNCEDENDWLTEIQIPIE